jgi:hypothetical protein
LVVVHLSQQESRHRRSSVVLASSNFTFFSQ